MCPIIFKKNKRPPQWQAEAVGKIMRKLFDTPGMSISGAKSRPQPSEESREDCLSHWHEVPGEFRSGPKTVRSFTRRAPAAANGGGGG